MLGLAGLLHDLGKLRVPEAILFKKEPLSEEERGFIRTHPYESHAILNTVGGNYSYLAECALHVMEKLDGSGYPQGLQGNAIHPYAQIIGVVDVYEAMTQPGMVCMAGRKEAASGETMEGWPESRAKIQYAS